MAEGHCPSGAQLAPTSTLETLLTQEGLEPGEAPAQVRDYPGVGPGLKQNQIKAHPSTSPHHSACGPGPLLSTFLMLNPEVI